MAINVNTVYTTVLTILNKEQRGYLTPFEFNNIANQVQLQIFEKFFEDYNQYIRMPKTNVEFASRMDHIREEFQLFEKTGPSITIPAGGAQTDNIYNQPSDLHRFGSASWNKGVNSPPIEILSNRDYNQIKLSPLTQPTNNFPVAKYQQDKLTVFPDSTPYASSDVTFNYIRKPDLVRWGYYVGGLGQFLYDETVFGVGLLNFAASILPSISPNLSVTAPSFALTVVEPGVTTGITITKANAAATGLKLDLAITLGSGITTLIVSTPGTGYSVGDKITFAGSTFDPDGGGTGVPGPDAVCTLASNNFNGSSTYGSTDFEISDSMQTETILEILKYAGVVIRDTQIIQAASQELAQDELNSKR
tara:strand:- start:29 stop:1114 length:1086 start_codon:yes stop_codon:yes gene_type:complete